MKIVRAKEMARIEKLAYQEGASEEDFMEKAGEGIAEFTQQFIARRHLKPHIALLCGRGNNAGDAYVAGRIILLGGFNVVAYSFARLEECSHLCQIQANRFKKAGGTIRFIGPNDEFDFDSQSLLLDGILGTGFHGEVEGLFRKAIEVANQSRKPIIAIDIPSGINGDTGEIGGVAIHAAATVFLGLPKTGCFIGEVWDHVGEVHQRNFGLDEKWVDLAEEDFHLLDENDLKNQLPAIVRTRHKYQAGYVVGLGGSPGMPGAPILSSYAALRAGAGIVRLLHPLGMEGELAGAPYEVIREGYEDSNTITNAIKKADAVFVGPGIGTSNRALKILKEMLPLIEMPCVIDAEALTLLAAHPIQLPSQTILTPHHGEMNRLLNLKTKELPKKKLFEACQRYCEDLNVTLVLKGAPTFIFHPNKKPDVCARGDPGMATAGSGDVLTGIVAAFLAQTQNTLSAAQLGVFCHSLAGEYAAAAYTSRSMVASNITEALPKVFTHLESTANTIVQTDSKTLIYT